jgi:radical SAM superfamily enzyme YgiQ (UPF0313 family)
MDFEKILLINPRAPRTDQNRKYAKAIPALVPLSLGYLAGYMHEQGIGAEIHDEQIELIDKEKLKHYINDQGYKVIGISSTTLYISRAMAIADMVKEISKDVKIIFGGVHPTVMPEHCLSNKNIDLVVRQEGEITLHQLMKYLNGEMKLEEIDGISYRQNGDFVHRPDRPMIQDLNSLPPFPYHMFAPHHEKYRFQVLSSRGCPYRCIFCSARSITGYKIRFVSPERVVNDIEYITNEFKKNKIAFADDTFTANKKHVKEICDRIIQKGLHKRVPLYCAARGDTVTKELLETMKSAGFQGLYFGIESGSDRILKLVQKGETVDANVQAVMLAKAAGLKVRGTFLIGLPTETTEESWQTINLAVKLPLNFASFSIATPFPGTKLAEFAKEEGFDSTDFSRFDIAGGLLGNQIPYIPKGRTYEELRKLQKRAYFKFYMKPSRLFSFFVNEIPDLNLKNFSIFDRIAIIAKLFLGQFKS